MLLCGIMNKLFSAKAYFDAGRMAQALAIEWLVIEFCRELWLKTKRHSQCEENIKNGTVIIVMMT